MLPREFSKAIYEESPIDLFCVGNPNVIGDSVGPLIGTLMSRNSYATDVNIIGTLRNPIVRSNYELQRRRIRPGAYVVGIDAALGAAVGTFSADIGPLSPGSGTEHGKVLPVGHMHIKCYTASILKGVFTDDERVIYHIAYKVIRELTDLLKISKKERIYKDI